MLVMLISVGHSVFRSFREFRDIFIYLFFVFFLIAPLLSKQLLSSITLHPFPPLQSVL